MSNEKEYLNRFLMYIGGDQILSAYAEDVNIFIEREHKSQKPDSLPCVSSRPIEDTEEYQQGFHEGYSKATNDACQEIEKNYTSNDKLSDGYIGR